MWKFGLALLLCTPVIIYGASTTRHVPGKIPVNEKPVPSNEPTEDSYKSVEFDGSWECGGEELSKFLSQQMIDKDCPQLLHPVNGCCIKHDKCYEDQEGQKNCDDRFCGCLDTVTYSPTNDTQVCHEDHSLYFCEMVKEFGSSFYEASINASVSGSTERADHRFKSNLVKMKLNESEPDETKHIRIYESKTYKTELALNGLLDLDTLN